MNIEVLVQGEGAQLPPLPELGLGGVAERIKHCRRRVGYGDLFAAALQAAYAGAQRAH